jgi:putative ABC transport system permease protein
MNSLRIAVRMLLKKPGFTAVAVLTLAVGIGANTALFSVVDKTFLNPIPLEGSDRMTTIREWGGNGWAGGVSPPIYAHLAQLTNVFEQVAAYGASHLSYHGGEFPEMLWGHQVTPNFFDWLQVRPLLGRTFVEGEGLKGTEERIVLSEALWEDRFKRDPDIIGREFSFAPYLDAPYKTYTVIGIMPKSFLFPNRDDGRKSRAFWIPRNLIALHSQGKKERNAKMLYALKNATVIARRAIDVSEEKAQSILNTIAEQHRGKGLLKDDVVRLEARPMSALFAPPEVRKTIWVAFSAIGFVLLIACANISNLQLVRAETRQKEFAIRAALGAGPWRVARQLLTESLLIALAGGGLGLLLTFMGTDLIATLVPAGIPRMNELVLDHRALAFAGILCLVCTAVFGLAPAWHPLRDGLNAALKDSGQGTQGAGREWMRKLLVGSQIAMAVVLLTGAGLMVRSVGKLLAVDPGYQPERLLSFNVFHLGDRGRGLQAEARESWLNTLAERLSGIPSIDQVGFSHITQAETVRIPESLRESKVDHHYTGIGRTDQLKTIGTRLLAGRAFQVGDESGSSILVNETMARRLWPDMQAVGKKVINPAGGRTHEVVGVVADNRTWALDQKVKPTFYEPYARAEWSGWSMVYVRTKTDPTATVNELRHAVHEFDSKLPPIEPSITSHSLLHQTLARRTYMWFLTGFALIGLVLAVIGIYGVLAYTVAQRTREFGVRMALGAQVSDVLRAVLGQGLRMVLIGILAGLAVATWLTEILSSQLFGISSNDATVYLVVALGMFGVAVIACLLPARRAANIQPMEALRYE